MISKCRFSIMILSLFLIFSLLPSQAFARIFIDINAPSVRKFNVALPDFKNNTAEEQYPELVSALPGVLSSDLDLSGYFSPIDKEAFLEDDSSALTLESINFKDWSVIGAELLVKGSYTCIGNSLEVEIRLFDVFWGKQIMGKRLLGDRRNFRRLMHRLGNEIIQKLTGYEGVCLTKLAFVSNSSGNKEIYVSDYDGHNITQITDDRSIALLPRWSPDGKKLLFNSYKGGKGPMLYMKTFSSDSERLISSREGLNIGACWSPDGRKVALTLSPKGNQDIFIIGLEGKILDRVTNQWGIDVSPVFSPDGKKMAFVSNRSGSPQLYILDLVNGREERLTFEGNYNTSPAWSSTDKIAFVSMNRGRFDIYTVDPDGGNLRRLTEDHGNNEDPCWSPDGRYILYSSNREGNYHLYCMNAFGKNKRRITYMNGDQTSPSWAP